MHWLRVSPPHDCGMAQEWTALRTYFLTTDSYPAPACPFIDAVKKFLGEPLHPSLLPSQLNATVSQLLYSCNLWSTFLSTSHMVFIRQHREDKPLPVTCK